MRGFISATTLIATGQAMRASDQMTQGSHLPQAVPAVTTGRPIPSTTTTPQNATVRAAEKGIGRNANARAEAAIHP